MPDTEIPDYEMFTMDWDWFAVDRDGCVGHFAPAGLRLPESVRCSRERLDLLFEYFENGPVLGTPRLAPELSQQRGWFGRPLDWSSFLNMAARGLYSYDTEQTHGSGTYVRAAIPSVPLHFSDLPSRISDVLGMTRLDLCFREAERIEESETLV